VRQHEELAEAIQLVRSGFFSRGDQTLFAVLVQGLLDRGVGESKGVARPWRTPPATGLVANSVSAERTRGLAKKREVGVASTRRNLLHQGAPSVAAIR
jgi:hypothetical protein